MTFRQLLDACRLQSPALPGAEEYVHQQQAIDARALWLREQRPMSAEDARAVALFSLCTWAQRYPVQSYDLGQDAALFIADWLTARAAGPTEDNLHEALKEWQARRAVSMLAR